MVRELIWSPNAKKIRKKILKYWIKRNKSKTYSVLLNEMFENSTKKIEEFPYSGIRVSGNLYRGKLVRDYYILYKIEVQTIEILFIWDCRKDPEELLNLVKNFHL